MFNKNDTFKKIGENNMKTKIIGILVIMLLCVTAISVTGTVNKNDTDISSLGSRTDVDDWPMFQHDPQNTGFTTAEAPETNTIIWNYEFEEDSHTDKLGTIFCFDVDTGEPIWRNETGINYMSGIAIVDDKIYIGQASRIYCYDANNGIKQWHTPVSGSYSFHSITVVDGRAYAGSWGGKICSVDASDGTLIWVFEPGNQAVSSPVVIDDCVYIVSKPGTLHCLDADTGLEEWNFTTGDLYNRNPAVVNDKIYIGDSETFYCLNASDEGDVLWSVPLGQSFSSCPAIAYGNVYINSNNNTMYCLDADTGDEIWNYLIINTSIFQPSVADEKIYFPGVFSPGGIRTMYCLDAMGNGDGTTDLIWSYEISNTGTAITSSAIADGKLFIVFGNKLFCFRDNSPPEIPETPDGPTECVIDVEYTYTTSTVTDPDGDDVEYLFDWGDGTDSGWIDIPSASKTWDEVGVFEVKVQAKDIYEDPLGWSEPLVVMVQPELEIGSIYGGDSKVTAEIINVGAADAPELHWNISVKGGLLRLINVSDEGDIEELEKNSIEVIDAKCSIRGFGIVEITVTIDAPYLTEPLTKTVNAFVIGRYILGLFLG